MPLYTTSSGSLPSYSSSSLLPVYKNVPLSLRRKDSSIGTPSLFGTDSVLGTESIIGTESLIGSKFDHLLVSHDSVVAHLRLLSAFHTLEESVSMPRKRPTAVSPSNPHPAVRWRVFLHQAVWRFEIWVKRVINVRESKGREDLRDEEIPPLDVILVWHAYLLNPRIYADDTKRVHRKLAAVGGLPLERVAAQINPDTFEFESTHEQVERWEHMTRLPHKPQPLSFYSRDELSIDCPRCVGSSVRTPWLRKPLLALNGYARGTGWCQNHFSIHCKTCKFEITRESIAVGRFAADIAAAMMDKNKVLAGTLIDPCECTFSSEIAQRLTALLLQPFANLPPAQQAIGEYIGWSFAGIEKNITKARHMLIDASKSLSSQNEQETQSTIGLPSRGRKELTTRILEAQKFVGHDAHGIWLSFGPRIATMLASYRDNPTSFSLDLVGSVVRQASFTAKAFSLGWLDPVDANPPVAQAITRYHNFLHLVSKFGYFLVPTLDIDLVWHTHQLTGDAYMSDTKRWVGRYLDHEDRVEEGVLSNGFDTTIRVWKNVFGTNYSTCEPLRSASISFPLVKKLSKWRLFGGHSTNRSGQDITTYPSEHSNTVVIRDRLVSSRRAERERKREKHKNRTGGDKPFIRSVTGRKGVPEHPNSAGIVVFGEMGLTGWAILGEVDQALIDAKTVAMGQCCAGYGLPYYGRPLWAKGAQDEFEDEKVVEEVEPDGLEKTDSGSVVIRG